jgi:photosystem II stability/assembly factor-like uncharacterized protein
MNKIGLLTLATLAVAVISGCSLSNSTSSTGGNFLKSSDGGSTWEAKIKFSDQKTIADVNIISMAIDPGNPQVIYIGTKEDGIFLTKDGGESWAKVDFPPIKVYGLAINQASSNIVYAAGVWNGRGKIYKSEDSSSTWKEVYTEPANGSVVVSLAESQFDGKVLYSGTSEGMIFKSTNGGETWSNLTKADGAVTEIAFDAKNGDVAYFVVTGRGILRTKDGGKTFDNIDKNMQGKGFSLSQRAYSVATDSLQGGILYVGLEQGVIKSTDFGDNWTMLNTLSQKFAVQAIAINPKNSNEIIYSAAQATYKSVDGGNQWLTSQLVTKNIADVIKYNPQDTGIIYMGMKKAD